MPDPQPNHDKAMSDKTLSEISHLFLSSVRDVQTGGAARPVRLPPGVRPQSVGDATTKGGGHPAESIDLTAEEYAQVLAGGEAPAGTGGPRSGSTAR